MKKKRIPEYKKLAAELKQEIFNGHLKNGDKLPGEFEIAKKHGLSRTTARLAVRELESESLVYRRRGSGTYVRSASILSSPFSIFVRSNTTGMARAVLRMNWTEANNELASLLDVPRGTRILSFRRLDSLDGVPVAFDDGWIVDKYADLLTSEDLEILEFWEHWQRKQNIVIHKNDLEIGAEFAGETRGKLLKTSPTAPVLVEYSTSFTKEEGACRFVSCYKHDSYRYRRVFHYNGDARPSGNDDFMEQKT